MCPGQKILTLKDLKPALRILRNVFFMNINNLISRSTQLEDRKLLREAATDLVKWLQETQYTCFNLISAVKAYVHV